MVSSVPMSSLDAVKEWLELDGLVTYVYVLIGQTSSLFMSISL